MFRRSGVPPWSPCQLRYFSGHVLFFSGSCSEIHRNYRLAKAPMFKRVVLFKKTKGRKGVPQGIGRARVLALRTKGTYPLLLYSSPLILNKTMKHEEELDGNNLKFCCCEVLLVLVCHGAEGTRHIRMSSWVIKDFRFKVPLFYYDGRFITTQAYSQ